MKRKPSLINLVTALVLLAALSGVANGSASGEIIPNDRKIDWSVAGIPGGIPTRTTICATINSAIYGSGAADASTAWEISYTGPAGDQPSPITGLPSTTRAFTLSGLTNYVLYTINLRAILNGAPFLISAVTVMPSGITLQLPMVFNNP